MGFGGLIGPLYGKRAVDGARVLAFRVEKQHTNGMKNCHGGMLMAFADMAFGGAAPEALGMPWVTVRLLTDFVAGAELGDFVEGAGEIIGRDRDFYTARGRIWVGARTVMTGSGIFKLLTRASHG